MQFCLVVDSLDSPQSLVLISREKDLIFNFSLSFIIFSSGKSFPTSTVSTLLELTMETVISNWKESMFIIMKPQVVNMSPVLFLWIWNPELWTQSDLDLTDKYSDQITLYLDSLEQETTGQKATTQKVINGNFSIKLNFWLYSTMKLILNILFLFLLILVLT